MIQKIKEISDKIIFIIAGLFGAIFILLKFLEGGQDKIEESIDEKEGENKQLKKNIKKNKEELKSIMNKIRAMKFTTSCIRNINDK